MKRKVCVFTGTRAEYGILYWLMKGIQNEPGLELQLIVSGAHLSPEFGLTYKEIEKDGFIIDKKVEMLLSADTPSAISKSTGLGLIGFADAYNDLKPDVIVLLGDRYELIAAALCALYFKLPIAHIGGGESTIGAFDEAVRHSITKMAWWHFVAAEEYKIRLRQLGEDPKRIFNVGNIGVSAIKNTKLLSKEKLMEKTGIKFWKRSLLVTYHPVTHENQTSEKHFKILLEVLDYFKDIYLIFTMPNSDTDGRILIQMIENWVKLHPNAKAYTSLGQLRYLSTIKFVDGVVGNSSSGLTEVPSFKKGTVNIGDRQRGRLKAISVINCEPKKTSIRNAIAELYSTEFQNKLMNVKNPYGSGGASEAIVNILKEISLDGILKKKFYNLRRS